MIAVATLWLVNENGELLLARRSATKDSEPNVWGPTVTGRAEAGEDLRATLLREAEEELGLTTASYQPQFLHDMDFMHSDGQLRRFAIYYASVPQDLSDQVRLQTDEVAAVAWMQLELVKAKLDASPQDLVSSALTVWPVTFQLLEAVVPADKRV